MIVGSIGRDSKKGKEGAREQAAMYLANKVQNIKGSADVLLRCAGLTFEELQPVADAMEKGGRKAAAKAVTDEILRKVCAIAGTPDECIERIEEYRAAGCTHIMLEIWGDDRTGQAKLFGEAVLPHFKKASQRLRPPANSSTIWRNSSSVSSPRFAIARFLTAARIGAALILRERNSEFLRLEIDAVESALFAQHDVALGVYQFRGVRLDRLGNVELARYCAALAHKKIFAHQWLPRFQSVAAGLLHDLRDFANLGQVQYDRHVVEAAQRQRDLADVGIAGALSHPVDRALNPRRAAPHGSHRARRGHPEIVVPVEVDWDLRSDPFASLPNQKLDRFRSTRADGINHDDFSRARFERRRVDLFARTRGPFACHPPQKRRR